MIRTVQRRTPSKTTDSYAKLPAKVLRVAKDLQTAVDTNVAVWRGDFTAGTDSYWLMCNLGGGRWMGYEFRKQTVSGKVFHALTDHRIAGVMETIDDTDASVTKSGSWTTVSNASAYGGSSQYSTTNNNFLQYTTPAGVTMVGMRGPKLTNGGYIKVLIDGDSTRATQLNTVATEVAAGRMSNLDQTTAGLANTDRVYSTYRASGDNDMEVVFADDLTAGSHVIKLVATGIHESASTAGRSYISGFCYSDGTQTPTGATRTVALKQPLFNLTNSAAASAWEYALKPVPTGYGGSAFVGNLHGNNDDQSFSVFVDGTDAIAALTSDKSGLVGSKVTARRKGTLYSPADGVTVIGSVTVNYTFTPQYLQVDNDITWSYTGTLTGAYLAMCPSDNTFDRCGTAADGVANGTLGANNDTNVCTGTSNAAWAWISTGVYGKSMYSPNARTMFVQDRSDNIDKIYSEHVPVTINMTPGFRQTNSFRVASGRVTSVDSVLTSP